MYVARRTGMPESVRWAIRVCLTTDDGSSAKREDGKMVEENSGGKAGHADGNAGGDRCQELRSKVLRSKNSGSSAVANKPYRVAPLPVRAGVAIIMGVWGSDHWGADLPTIGGLIFGSITD